MTTLGWFIVGTICSLLALFNKPKRHDGFGNSVVIKGDNNINIQTSSKKGDTVYRVKWNDNSHGLLISGENMHQSQKSKWDMRFMVGDNEVRMYDYKNDRYLHVRCDSDAITELFIKYNNLEVVDKY